MLGPALLHLPFEDAPQITFTLSFLARQWSSWRCVGVVIMLEHCPAAQSPKGEDHALLQYVTVHVGIHGSLNELLLPSAGSTHVAPDMTLQPPCLTVGKTHLSLYSSPGCRHSRLTPSEPNKFILVSFRPQDMVPVIHVHVQVCLSSPNCLRAFLCIIFKKRLSSGTTAMQTNLMQCAAYGLSMTGWPPTLQPLQQCWQHSYLFFQNTTVWQDAEHVQSTYFGQPWRGLFWVEPVLLNRCTFIHS